MKRVITKNCKTREELAAPYSHLTHLEQMQKSGAIDLRNNYQITSDGGGYVSIAPIDPTKTFSSDDGFGTTATCLPKAYIAHWDADVKPDDLNATDAVNASEVRD